MDRRTFIQAGATGMLMAAGGFTLAAETPPAIPVIRHTLEGFDNQNKPVSLDDYAGKVCLVSFFTAGCNLCMHDLKLMREFNMDNRTRNFVLIGVNIDERKEDYLDYMRLISLSVPADQRFPIVWRNAPKHQDSFGKIAKKPTHFILDKAHRQVLRREGAFQPSDWDDLWASLS
jgi:peroxiredoxin